MEASRIVWIIAIMLEGMALIGVLIFSIRFVNENAACFRNPYRKKKAILLRMMPLIAAGTAIGMCYLINALLIQLTNPK